MPVGYHVAVLSLVLPSYNEGKNIPLLLPRIAKALEGMPYEVIVVDDDSPDRTWEIAEGLAAQYPVRVLRRVGRHGLSSAVLEGFAMAKGTVLGVMDADGQHDEGILPALYRDVVERGGVAVGSRYVAGGGIHEQWSANRRFLSKAATWLTRIACNVTVSDPMSGFFLLSRDLYLREQSRLNPKGFKILLEILAGLPADTSVSEVPFRFRVREHGESKLTLKVQWHFLAQLLRLWWVRVRG